MAQLTIDRTGAAALVTLNRPEKRNALSIELRLALADTLAELAADDTVAAIGITGAGSSFPASREGAPRWWLSGLAYVPVPLLPGGRLGPRCDPSPTRP